MTEQAEMFRKQPIEEAQALRRLADLCAKSEHCSGEMREKMRRWGLAEEAQNRILDRLTSQKYIDNERFTRSFVHDKIRCNKWGRRKIEQALREKRVERQTAQTVLDEVGAEEYLEVLRPLLKNKYPTIKAATDYERSVKLIKFAMSRGFTIDLIRRCIDEAGFDDVSDDIDFTNDNDADN